MAIGNPFGFGGTVTAGIISARGRNLNAGPYDDFIQTDASINRGNSGGPMFNLDGEVIGVNTAIISPSGGSIGLGFAVPSSTVEPVIKQLIKHGEVKRGWLGVHIQTVTEELAETLGLEEPEGALVASVIKDGPAEGAGIKAGDVILKFNGRTVNEMRALPRIVADTEVGKDVEVEIWRDSKKITITAAVGELQKGPEMAAKSSSGGEEGDGGERTIVDLGLSVSPVNEGLRKKYKLNKDAKGVIVTEVDGTGPAAEKGISAGDLIVEVSQEEVTTPTQIINKVKEAKKAGRKTVLLLLEGRGGLRFVAIRIEKT
jgi:serine protease Do